MRSGWTSASLESCIEDVAYTTKIQRKDFLPEGKYPVISQEEAFINGYWNDDRDVFRVRTPLVVFGDHTKALKYVDFDFVLGADGVKLLQPVSVLEPRFFYYQLQALIGQIESLGYARHYRLLRELEIAYPSVSEQRRIVAILDEAFERIAIARANAEKNLQNARELFESELNDAISRKRVGSIATSIGREVDLLCGFAFKSARYTESPTDRRLLRGDNIMQGYLRWDDVKRWPISDVDTYAAYELREDDVVMAMDRPWVQAGLKCALLAKDDLPCLLVQRVARLRRGPRLLPQFLAYLIGSEAFAHHILGVQTGIGVPHVSGQQIKSFSFEMPGLDDQRRLVQLLVELQTECRRVESIYRRKLAALDELKQSLLHEAFSGKL